jgi:hypothetical protein
MPIHPVLKTLPDDVDAAASVTLAAVALIDDFYKLCCDGIQECLRLGAQAHELQPLEALVVALQNERDALAATIAAA